MNEKNNRLINIIFICFIILFVLSYTHIGYSTIIRYMATIILSIIGILNLIINNKSIKINNKNCSILIFLLVFNMIFSIIFSNYRSESFIKTLTIFYSFFLFFLLIPNLIEKLSFKTIFKTIFVAMVIVLSYEYLRFGNIYLYDGGNRLSATHIRLMLDFIYPSSLGWPAFLLCISSLYLFDYKNVSFFKNIIYIFGFIFGLFLLYKCDIRTSIYTLFIFIFMFLFLYKIKTFKLFSSNKKIFRFLSRLIVIILVIIIGFYFIGGNISYNKLDAILSYRLTYYVYAIKELLHGNLLFGLGAYRNSIGSSLGIYQIDNSYLNFVYSYGLINILLLLAFIMIIIKMINNKNTKNNNEYRNKCFILSLFISFLIYSFFEITLLNISSILALITWPIIIKYIKSDNQGGV